jgi:hypothetical protein
MRKRIFVLLCFLLALGLVVACKGAAAETTQTTPATQLTVANDVVHVNYFFESDACFCLHLAGQWITDTVHNDYKAQLDSGKMTYNEWDTKDSANDVKKAEFNATNYGLYITVVKGGQQNTSSVNSLWLYTDSSGKNEVLKTKFIGVLKTALDKALAGA